MITPSAEHPPPEQEQLYPGRTAAVAFAKEGADVPVWTPLIPATFPGEKAGTFGSQVPMGRAAHPDEITPSYVFFASGRLSSYYSGQVLARRRGDAARVTAR
jgi:NAD(P)-dependent dehydrogenase (short-subunit alcohol dehydrogenase family)